MNKKELYLESIKALIEKLPNDIDLLSDYSKLTILKQVKIATQKFLKDKL